METVTFYSYKGGTGRTLALSNIALLLAHLGFRVVAVDFDLEAPGLPYKLLGDNVRRADGVVGWLRDSLAGEQPSSIEDYVLDVPVDTATPRGGSLRVIPAGRAPSPNYFQDLRRLRLEHHLDNGMAIEALVDLQRVVAEQLHADYLLIDARTGVTSTNAVTTHVLADHVVVLTLNTLEQLEGTRSVLRGLKPLTSIRTNEPIALHVALSRTQPSPGDLPWHEATENERRMMHHVAAYLSEPATPMDRTLAVERIHLLHTDLKMMSAEVLSFARLDVERASTLHGDYMRLAKAVFGDAVEVAIAETLRDARHRDPSFLEAFGYFLAHEESVTTARATERRSTSTTSRTERTLQERLEELSARADRDASLRPELGALTTEMVQRLLELGRAEDARPYAERAVAVFRQLAVRTDPIFDKNLTSALHDLAIACLHSGDVAAAEQAAVEAIVVRRRIGTDTRDDQFELADQLETLATIRRRKGNMHGVIEAADESVRLFAENAQESRLAPLQLPSALDHLASAHWSLGDVDAAVAARRVAVELYRVAAENDDTFLSVLAGNLESLAEMSHTSGAEDGLDHAYEAVEIRRELWRQGLDEGGIFLALGLLLLGDLLARRERHDGAMSAFEEAIELLRPSADENQATANVLADLLHNAAFAASRSGQSVAAQRFIKECVTVRRRLLDDSETSRIALAEELQALASYNMLDDDEGGAADAADEAVDLVRGAYVKDPEEFRDTLLGSLITASLAHGASDPERALELLNEAEELVRLAGQEGSVEEATVRLGRAVILSELGHRDDALPAAQDAVRLWRALYTRDGDPTSLGMALSLLARLYENAGEPKRAAQLQSEVKRIIAEIEHDPADG